MIRTTRNIAHNPRFLLWPWGTSGFAGVASSVNYGKTAARWGLQKTAAGGDVVTVSRGNNSNTTKYDKWMRGAANMTIQVDALAPASTMKIQQFLDGMEVLGQNLLATTILASGPRGATFYFGAGVNMAQITTLGDDSAGDPIVVSKTVVLPFDDPAYTYLRIIPFESPSDPGTYRLHDVQVDPIMSRDQIAPMEIRTATEEWRMIEQYITPIRPGMLAVGAASTQVRVSVPAPLGGWRQTPVIPTEGRAASMSVHLGSAGTLITAAAPALSIAANPVASEQLLVAAISGFPSNITSGSQYHLGGTEPLFYANADYM